MSLPQQRRTLLLCVAVTVAIGVYSFFGEHIQVAGGVGTDGQIYADMMRGLPHNLWDGSLSPYYAHRIVVPLIMRGIFEILQLPLSNDNIWRAFAIYTIVLQAGSAMLWVAIGRLRQLTEPQTWLGFLALFVNFGAAKNSQFMPVLLDSSAIFLSLASLLFFLKANRAALCATSIIGGLTWSMASLVGALLLAFPLRDLEPEPRRMDQRLLWLPVLAMAAAIAVYLAMQPPDCLLQQHAADFARLPGKIASHVCVTAQAAATFWPAGALAFVAFVRLVWAKGWLVRPTNIVLALATIAVPELIARSIGNPAVHQGADLFLIAEMALTPAPGLFFLPLVSLAVFWGPLVLVGVLRWADVCQRARMLGVGAVVILTLALLLMLPTEPRYITYFWPVIVLCIVQASADVTAAFAGWFAVLSFAASKLWLTINTGPWTANASRVSELFPQQLYFMNMGYWMIPSTFWIQAAVCILCLLVLSAWDRASVRRYRSRL